MFIWCSISDFRDKEQEDLQAALRVLGGLRQCLCAKGQRSSEADGQFA